MALSIYRSANDLSKISSVYQTPKQNQISQSRGVLKRSLPDGIIPVYFSDKAFIVKGNQGESRRLGAISLLENLKYETHTSIESLKRSHRICALHVKNGKIQSLTVTPEQIELLKKARINQIAFKVNNTLLNITDRINLRTFTSKDEYLGFAKLSQKV